MITGNGEYHDGYLSLTINNKVKFTSKWFEYNDKVIDECFSSLDSIVVQNLKNDGWAGQIMVKYMKETVDLICTSGCTNSNDEWNNKVVVDGNADWDSDAPDSTWCFDTKPCVFKSKGTKRYHRF